MIVISSWSLSLGIAPSSYLRLHSLRPKMIVRVSKWARLRSVDHVAYVGLIVGKASHVTYENIPIKVYTYLKNFELCIYVQLWEIIHVPCMKSSILSLQFCNLCYSKMSHGTLILYYQSSMLTLQTFVTSCALWLPHAWYYEVWSVHDDLATTLMIFGLVTFS